MAFVMKAAIVKKAGTHTNDSKNVGKTVAHHKSIASVKSAYPGSKTTHAGQPLSLPGKGLMTGHTKTNY